ncbi:MAG TPA: hypothetical protein PKD09_24815 [Aggregatilinea sp.]|uniref:hypothetical protein n=1 Tax=Aggregatilinea sp. TaxID=2806333 RepID=UPI002BE3C3C0|nr:hypothetical protein [Aggregatilinea sp.]HML24901.1 hypothetical protein [Aggregatilinea sp.]
MRKTVILPVVGMMVVLGLAIAFGPVGVQAQGNPTPTLNVAGVLGQKRTPTAGVTPVQPEPTELPAATGTPQPSGSQLVWVQTNAGFSPMVFNDVTVGGPVDTYAMIGDPCAQGVYSAELPVFELHLLSDTGFLRIGFLADDGSATAMLLWDSVQQTWWCTIDASPGSELTFDSMAAGDYPVYVAVQGGPGKISGQLYITEEQP